MMGMNVLVACEFSAVVRDAFRALGHNAWSVDLLPTEGDPAWHIQGDALDAARRPGWDLIIAHPPCTRLTRAGVRWLHERKLWDDMRRDALFFRSFLELDNVPMVAVENPVMHRYATEVVGRKQDQIIQPWMFGHMESKGTGLWLKGLPALKSTNNVREATMALTPKERDKVHWMAPGSDRWKARSRTYAGVAQAMAEQWGSL
jgi:site-specific DNA-cytosine methylase